MGINSNTHILIHTSLHPMEIYMTIHKRQNVICNLQSAKCNLQSAICKVQSTNCTKQIEEKKIQQSILYNQNTESKLHEANSAE